jgi:hypothetical protein
MDQGSSGVASTDPLCMHGVSILTLEATEQ